MTFDIGALRKLADRCPHFHIEDEIFQQALRQAADEIEALRTEIDRRNRTFCEFRELCLDTQKRAESAEAKLAHYREATIILRDYKHTEPDAFIYRSRLNPLFEALAADVSRGDEP